jgi:hypothetical protein
VRRRSREVEPRDLLTRPTRAEPSPKPASPPSLSSKLAGRPRRATFRKATICLNRIEKEIKTDLDSADNHPTTQPLPNPSNIYVSQRSPPAYDTPAWLCPPMECFSPLLYPLLAAVVPPFEQPDDAASSSPLIVDASSVLLAWASGRLAGRQEASCRKPPLSLLLSI